MNRIAMLIALALPSAAAFAQSPNPLPQGAVENPGGGFIMTAPAGGFAAPKPADMAKFYIQSIDDVVALTDVQKQTITDIFAQREKDLHDFNAQNGEKITAASKVVADAYKSQDPDALAKAQEDFQALFKPMNDIMNKAQEKLDKLLTPAQKARLADHQQTEMIKMMAYPATLTENQIKAVKAAADPDGENPVGDWQAMHDALDNVLTPQQKAVIHKSHAMMMVRNHFIIAGLTADQLKKMETACDQLVKDPNLDSNEIEVALAEKVAALLSPDQKKIMDAPPAPGSIVLPPLGQRRPPPAPAR